MPKNTEESQFVPQIVPKNDEIVFTKTTDSALTGTNMRLVLRNMGIKNVIMAGIFKEPEKGRASGNERGERTGARVTVRR